MGILSHSSVDLVHTFPDLRVHVTVPKIAAPKVSSLQWQGNDLARAPVHI